MGRASLPRRKARRGLTAWWEPACQISGLLSVSRCVDSVVPARLFKGRHFLSTSIPLLVGLCYDARGSSAEGPYFQLFRAEERPERLVIDVLLPQCRTGSARMRLWRSTSSPLGRKTGYASRPAGILAD